MGENKKKGKKKKGNQTKHSASTFPAEDVNQTKPDDSMQNHHIGAPSNADSQSVGVSESDLEQEKRNNCEEKCVELLEEINKLEVEKNICSQKEGFLEERIKLLQNEVDSCIQKEASLEEQIDDLQCKNASLAMREADFEERVKKMEEMHQSFALEESSIKEVVSKLDDANEGLHLQVMELKDSRDSLAQENKQLTDSISTLESRIQHLEMVASFNVSSKIHGQEKPHLKAVETSTKPDILNEDPSEKVSEIHVEPVPVQLAGPAENPTSEKTIKHSSSTMKSSTSTDYALEYNKTLLESNEKIETFTKTNESSSVNGIEDLSSMEQLQQIQLLELNDSRVSEDVISVPLDDIIQELQATPEKSEAEPAVPLSDAPLIGAPFRLISFVARFVSGADLVDQGKPKRDF